MADRHKQTCSWPAHLTSNRGQQNDVGRLLGSSSLSLGCISCNVHAAEACSLA